MSSHPASLPSPRAITQDQLADIVAQRIQAGMWATDAEGQIVVFSGWKLHCTNGSTWFTRC